MNGKRIEIRISVKGDFEFSRLVLKYSSAAVPPLRDGLIETVK